HRLPPPHATLAFPTRRSSDLIRAGCVRKDGSELVPAETPPKKRKKRKKPPERRFWRGGSVRLKRLMRLKGHNRVGLVAPPGESQDRKSTRLNSSHGSISYAVF